MTKKHQLLITLAALIPLCSACGNSDLGLGDFGRTLRGASPIETWHGKAVQIVEGEQVPLPDVTVVLKVQPDEAELQKVHPDVTGEDFRSLVRSRTATFSALSGQNGAFDLAYRWRKGYLYSLAASYRSPEGVHMIVTTEPIALTEKGPQVDILVLQPAAGQ